MDAKVIKQRILPAQYEDVAGDNLINLPVVLEDMNNQERALASEEFNIVSPELTVEIADEDSVVLGEKHMATVAFTNPFSYPESGVLTIAGAGLIQGKIHFRMRQLLPGRRGKQSISFIPSKVRRKILQASLPLNNTRSTIRGLNMVLVKRA